MLDPGAGGVMMPLMKGFKQAAADGSFAVNETGGQALLVALREMAKWVDDNLSDFNTAHRGLPLGSSHGANVMKPYMENVATDDQGFFTRLREFRDSLADAEEGVLAAMRNYGTMEQGIQGHFREP